MVVAAVRALGLLVTGPPVLGVGANLVIHLAPAPLMARVGSAAW